MRNTNTILLMTLLTCSIALSPLTSTLHAALLPGPRIYLDSSDNTFYSNTTSVGHRFNVTIWVENVTVDLGGAQIYLEFNDSIINVTRWWAPDWRGDFFMPDPYSALPAPPDDAGYVHVGPGEGYVKVSVLKGGLPPTPPWGGNGTICIFEFKITAVPPEDGQLTCPLHINTVDTYLLDWDASEVPDVTKEDGTYTFNYAPPPPSAPHIWLEASPNTYQAIKPRPFNVSIIIQNVSALDCLIGIQLIVSYNATVLEAAEIMQGDFLSNPTWAPYGTLPTYYVDERGVIYGEMIIPESTGEWNPPFPEGNGTVATITFLPILHEEANFDISIQGLFGDFFLNKQGEFMPYLPPKNCSYTYSPLPVPLLATTPSEYTASYIGETFDINVTINNLDALWNMTYAEFNLDYNNNSLQVLNIVEGDFLSQFGTTTFNQTEIDGCIKMNISLIPTTYPFGSGTLATITFNVTSCPGSCELLLSETKLLDFEMEEVLHEVQHGYYELHMILVHPIVWGTETYYVVTVSNSCVTPVPMLFYQPQMMLSFDVTGNNDTIGFVEITIPQVLLNASAPDWFVIVGGQMVEVTVGQNETHTTLHFTFSLSSKTVYVLGTSVIPEMSTNVFILLLLAATLMGLAVAKKAGLKKREELVYFKTPSTRQ